MEACLPGSSRRWRLAIWALSLVGGACSERNIVAVDPNPCAEAGAVGCAPGLLDGLVGYWHLNEPSGSTSARDSSTWGNNGTLVGIDPSTAWVSDGPGGRSLALSGAGHINVMTSASINSIIEQVTVAAWIYIDGTIAENSFATAISRQVGTGFEQHYHLSLTPRLQPAVFLFTTAGRAGVIFAKDSVSQRTWVHIAATYDGSQCRLYRDGVEVGNKAASGSFVTETNPLILAGNGNDVMKEVSEAVPGRLSEIMLYRRALGADEIARLHALLPMTDPRPDAGSP